MWTPIVGRSFTAAEFAEYCRTVKLAMFKPSFVTVHNTYIPTKAQWTQHPVSHWMDSLTHQYRDVDGWHAGPHLFVDDKVITIFTPLDKPGVHSPSWNNTAWGVETVGDFETEPFDPATEGNLIAALAALHRLGNLDPNTIRFHKEDPKTTHKGCPGKNMVKGEIIAKVRAAMNEPYVGA